MMLNFIIYMGTVFLLLSRCDSSRVCHSTDVCSCKFSDNSREISLRAIDYAHPPPARFQDKTQVHSSQFNFNYNPCTPIDVGDCKGQLVCQKSIISKNMAFSAATPRTHTVTYDGKNVIFKYTGTMQGGVTRKTEITLKCDKTNKVPIMSDVVEDDTVGSPVFKFTLTTKCACEGVCPSDSKPADHHNLSTGSILCIVLLVLVVIYFIGGFLFLKFYKKNEGTEAIPNRDFWTDFPSKVKDGCSFIYGKVRKRDDAYEKI